MIELVDICTEESDFRLLEKPLALAGSSTHSQLLVAAAPWRQDLYTTAPSSRGTEGLHRPSPTGGLGLAGLSLSFFFFFF